MALTELNRNWNSHGAQPLDYGCLLSGLDALIAVLHPDSIAPSVFPMANGGINFEWSKAEFSIEVSADRDSGVILSYTDSDREWDGPLEETPSYVEDAFKQLARD